MNRTVRTRVPRPLGLLVAMLVALPLVLTACGGETASTATAAPAATTATGAATKPASTTAPAAATTAPAAATTAPGAATTPAGSAPAAATTATGSAAPAANAPKLVNLTLPDTSKRGEGGNLRLLWWQAPTILNLHLAAGTKDFDAARLVVEPLATTSVGSLVPDVLVLAKEMPSVQNGGLSADGTTVTWKLKDNIVWSDGEKFTADDVVFTWKFITNKTNGATTVSYYSIIKDAVAVDPTTVKITFAAPTAVWYLPFTGVFGAVLPKHSLESCTTITQCPYNQKPIGTGPYVVTDFKSGDTVLYKANDKFREANAPYFATVEMKGGGDAVTAMKAVQTGQADYAWNPQVGPDIYKQFTDAGGVLEQNPGASTERIFVNFSDPSTEVDGEKSSPKSKSPFWTDKNVRQALSLAIDRDAMAKNLYGLAGRATNTPIPSIYAGPEFKYDPKKANELLDAAGWKMGSDGVRVKDGKKFAITFRTSVNAVRDKESQLIKQNMKDIGVAVELKPVDSAIFFGQPDNSDQRVRFETDLEMYTNGASSPDMQAFFEDFSTDQIAAKANGWKGTNVMRWSNKEFDDTLATLKTTLDPAKRIELFKKLDSILIGDYAQIPLIARTGLGARSAKIEGVNLTMWDSDVWNIAHWTNKGK